MESPAKTFWADTGMAPIDSKANTTNGFDLLV